MPKAVKGRRPIFKVTDYIERDLKWEEAECRKLGVRFEAAQLKNAAAARLISFAKDADIVLVNMAGFSSKVISGLKKAKLIIRHGIGYDNVDVKAATGQGIVFANQRGASAQDVAEHAVMLILETYKKRKRQQKMLRDWVATGLWISWRIQPLYRLQGKIVGIVGCGNIGSRVLKIMRGFGVEILVCDPYLKRERLEELGAQHTPLAEVVSRSDVITLHIPVTDETRGLFDLQKFSQMKKSAVIVNTSRGPVVKTKDLIKALKTRLIAGAGLDVFEKEPPPGRLPLLAMDNAVLSPHVAWYSEEGGWDIRVMIMDDVRAYLKGRLPRYVVNPEVLSRPNLRFKVSGSNSGL